MPPPRDDDESAAAAATAAATASFVDEDYAAAEAHYTLALTKKPGDAELLCGRAASRLKLGSWIDAADDARRASAACPDLAIAHMRRGIALFHLDEYEASRDSLSRAVELFEKQKNGGSSEATAKRWLRKARAELGEEGEKAPSRCGCGVAHPHSHDAPSAPPPDKGKKGEEAAASEEEKEEGRAVSGAATAAGVADASPSRSPAPAPRPQQPRFRHQWFQTHEAVEVGVLAKGLRSEDVEVAVEPRRLVVVVGKGPPSSTASPPSSSSPPRFKLDLPLAGEVVPSESRHSVLSTKVEIKLRKAAPGLAWPSLEATTKGEENEQPPPPPLAPPPPPAAEATATATAADNKPTYPSSNPKRVDWDRLDAELSRELADEDEGELEEAEGGEEKLQRLFETIFSGGDDDVRRAMNKSFVESGGTCLSTSWKEVAKGKVGEGYCGDDDDEGGLARRDYEEED